MPLPDGAAVALARVVAAGPRQFVEEALEIHRFIDLGQQVDHTSGVPEDLHGLDPGEVVEEPATGRVHEERMALRFEEGESDDVVGLGPAVFVEEVVDRALPEDDPDVTVTRRPWIAEHRPATTLHHTDRVLAQ